MCKLGQIGVERQYESANKYEADRNFRISCNLCCHRGMCLDCDRCAIAVAHELVIATYDKHDSEAEDDAVEEGDEA